MQMIFTHSHINDPSGSEVISTMDDFILKLPGIGLIIRKAKVIPPLKIVNELLSTGKCDAGMSGCFEWQPLQIQEKEYQIFKKSLEQILGTEAVFLDEEGLTLKKWMSLARSHFKR